MANDLIHIRLSKHLKKQIQEFVNEGLFSNITDFMKEAVRAKISEYETKIMISRLRRNMGCMKGKAKLLTKKERERFAEEFVKKDTSNIFKEYGLE